METPMEISAILNRNGSDKCYSHTYQIVYDGLFKSYKKDAPLDILESGVEKGGSLCAWKEYFPNAKVTGVDIVDARLPEFKTNDVEFVLSDIKKYKPDRKFDIIIEDGNHSNHDALWSALNLTKHLKEQGVLIIEDVQEGYALPFILWGQLNGRFVVQTVDMRLLTKTHDNFMLVIALI
jgi:hypothetical protein